VGEAPTEIPTYFPNDLEILYFFISILHQYQGATMNRSQVLSSMVTILVIGMLFVTGGSTQAKDTKQPVNFAELDPNTRVSNIGKISPPMNRVIAKDVIVSVSSANSITDSTSTLTLYTLPFTGRRSQITPIGDDASIQHIIGPDNRTQTPNTSVFPASAVVLIETNTGWCTGWLYDDDTVATAAHCIHNGGQWVTSVTVTPGRNGNSKPFGTCGAVSLNVVAGWIATGFPDYDYGAIKLNCRVGINTGWFGMKTQRGPSSYVKGYPQDKPYGTQWQSTGTASSWVDPIISITNDVKPGDSGAPVYYTFSDCNPCGYGIFANESGFGPATNFATGISPSIFNNLQSWK
jgi:glutamyl endopeptidase